ncbi:hypothetical protein GCM10011578_011660 [Streptomyces fuscichromogenes]|uniref:Uncharacterized protein n=2 Tax=Streptomyces fuscichromogenes TaxID=1324013 RepID=A0A917UI54_9ACTN|nr:hypothetical protein GCM10011578_011660 [Streptomyces fuscichromogenes]
MTDCIRAVRDNVSPAMDMQKRPQQPPQPQHPEGCLVVAIRIPVRIFVFLVVLPVRLLWDAFTATARFLWRYLLAPLGRAIGRILHALLVVPLIWLYRYLLTPLGHALLWLHARVLTPIGHALVWLHARVLTPIGHAVVWLLTPVARAVEWVFRMLGTALYWTVRVLLVLPALALWRWILAPSGRLLGIVLREIGEALGHAWRAAGYVARAAGRVLGTLFRWIFLEPARRVYRTVLTPVGHLVRDLVLHPVAEAARAIGRAVRQARADLRRALFGEPRRPAPVERREPGGRDTRTLDG